MVEEKRGIIFFDWLMRDTLPYPIQQGEKTYDHQRTENENWWPVDDFLDGRPGQSTGCYWADDIVHNGLLKDMSVLQESPFTDTGSIVEIFTDLKVWQGIRGVIDKINANAVAM